MKYMRGVAALALAGWALACSDSTAPHDHELTVNLVISSAEGHLVTLDEVTFTVSVTDGDGHAVTDFTTLQVEFELEDVAGVWNPIELAPQGSAYVGTYDFGTSGEYHFRVSGMRDSDTSLEVLYALPEHVEIERAHNTVGDYRVEFESYPGHIHAGESATLRFWVTDATAGTPVTGLTAAITCGNPDGTTEEHSVTDNGDGMYESAHMFMDGGEGHAELEFTDPASMQWQTEFHLHIAHEH
jgi:hypothetical protein